MNCGFGNEGAHPGDPPSQSVAMRFAPSMVHMPVEGFRSHMSTKAAWLWFRSYVSGLAPTVPRSMGRRWMFAPVEFVPLLAMSYWDALGLVLLQELLLPLGGRHSP